MSASKNTSAAATAKRSRVKPVKLERSGWPVAQELLARTITANNQSLGRRENEVVE
jgi:hypothetical protein